jgi:hypothetical protein
MFEGGAPLNAAGLGTTYFKIRLTHHKMIAIRQKA